MPYSTEYLKVQRRGKGLLEVATLYAIIRALVLNVRSIVANEIGKELSKIDV